MAAEAAAPAGAASPPAAAAPPPAVHADPAAASPREDGAPDDAVGDEEARKAEAKRAANKAKKLKQKAKEKEKKAAAAAGAAGGPAGAAAGADASNGPARRDTKEEAKAKQQMLKELLVASSHKSDGRPKDHNFWNTQPVPQLDEAQKEATGEEDPQAEGQIHEDKTPKDVRQMPYDLPEGMEWWNPDVTDPDTMRRIYELLRDHYVEDDDSMFRFNYSEDFLKWALLPPGYKVDWHVSIRSIENPDTTIGFISGIPVNIRVGQHTVRMCEINFLCVNKRTRDKGLAPLLIQEVTRRVNLEGIWQAVYTAGIVLPTPIARCQYWHRSLNPQKLIQIGFSSVPRRFEKFSKPLDQVKKHYSLPAQPKIPGLRQMTKKDHKQVRVLLEDYLKAFDIAPIWTNDEIVHWFLPKENVIDTYVVQDPQTKALTDVLSFYSLPSTIIGDKRHKILRAAYSYYNVPRTCDLTTLLEDALILAKKQEFDVFNALDIMANKPTFEALKFGPGDGHLQYYLYNWRFRTMKPEQVGLVLL